MRRAFPLLAVALLAGCSKQEPESLPAACSDAPAVERALATAPEGVRIEGRPLSRCLPKDATGANVQEAGITFTRVAGRLADRRDAVRLGYLVGAARRGAKRSQVGVYSELLRRLELELNAVDTGSPAFRAAEAAGMASG